MTQEKWYQASNRIDWETPLWLYERMNQEFHFTRDVCALPHNHKHEIYWTPSDDALSKEWAGILWMNPPYGRGMTGVWMKKAYEAACSGSATVVCLIPARTDTTWWHDYCTKGEIRFLRGRVNFVGSKNGSTFPSALVIFHAHLDPGSVYTFVDYKGCK